MLRLPEERSGKKDARKGGRVEKKRNWLILTHCCNLDGRAASQHIDDRLPYLKREGITPLMLTGPTGPPLADTRASG